ncbi:MAG: putative pterin-4-alpha-carbinolamine dehydratase [Chlamydiae bacterium]|nr:putative pterin-4-alpha-carbinolamine dehydratase [Chlamydiota bacterium]
MTKLAEKKCQACKGDTPPLEGETLSSLKKELGSKWKVVNDHHLESEFQFPNFKEALAFTNRVGELADKEGHHPDIHLSWGKVRIVIWTHKINGLSESDFILAAKIEKL